MKNRTGIALKSSLYLLVLLVSMLFIGLLEASAQKTKITSQEQLTQVVSNYLDEIATHEKFLEFAQDYNVAGSYTFHMTFYKKGKVETIRATERSENASVSGQNELLNYLKELKLPIKLPKDTRYTLDYTFNL